MAAVEVMQGVGTAKDKSVMTGGLAVASWAVQMNWMAEAVVMRKVAKVAVVLAAVVTLVAAVVVAVAVAMAMAMKAVEGAVMAQEVEWAGAKLGAMEVAHTAEEMATLRAVARIEVAEEIEANEA